MIADHPHPQDPKARQVVWHTKAVVTGYGTEPEPYLILRLPNNQYLHMPMAVHESINDWPMRSNVNLHIELDNLP